MFVRTPITVGLVVCQDCRKPTRAADLMQDVGRDRAFICTACARERGESGA